LRDSMLAALGNVRPSHLLDFGFRIADFGFEESDNRKSQSEIGDPQ
jgi:hypothetical protein